MKSLEIVNRNIKAIKKLLYKLKDVQEGTKEDFEKYYHEQELKDFKIIKQDLEILEIIRNKKVDLQGLSYLLNEYKDAELAYILNQYNPTEYYTMHSRGCLTLEELLKLKQWLEVNEWCLMVENLAKY